MVNNSNDLGYTSSDATRSDLMQLGLVADSDCNSAPHRLFPCDFKELNDRTQWANQHCREEIILAEITLRQRSRLLLLAT
tara:strand:- start:223 stop:462 length:240 start_codon:yes stop_codon:yes gene_type:complete